MVRHDGARIVIADLGTLLLITGLVPLLTLPVSLAYGEWHAAGVMALTALVFGSLGLVLTRLRTQAEPRHRHAMIIAALGWLAVPAVSTIPFVWIYGMPALDAYFEAMSGWTGTGLTMVDAPSELPRTIQWWRTLTQWVGGVGVIVLTLSILAHPGTGAWTLYHSEGREERIRPSILGTARTIWWIYLLYSVIAVMLVYAAGMPPWHALNHGLTALSTAGFSITDESIATYDSPLIEWALIIPMTLGAIAFIAHYDLLRKRVRAFFADPQVRVLLGGYVVGVVLLAWALHDVDPDHAWREALFQFVSALSSTGFQTANIHEWTANAKLFVAATMLFGGAAGSTAGGFKLVRGILLAKGVGYKLRRVQLPPHAMISFDLGGRRLTSAQADREIAEVAFVGFIWFILLLAGVFTLLQYAPAGYTTADVIFEVASAHDNIGLSTGITGPDLPTPAKVAMIFGMWAGRLEIFPVLVLLRSVLLRRGAY